MHKAYIRNIPKSKNAIIFIHGIIGTPNHFMRFYPLIPEEVSIYNLLLDGHGGSVEDFSKTSMHKWKAQVKQEIDKAKNEHQDIYIVAHSMGCLLAMEYSIIYPKQIKGLFLMAVPLHMHVTPLALSNALGTIYEFDDHQNEQLQSAKAMYSVDTEKNILKYTRWLPRYMELLRLSQWTRNNITSLITTTICVQSKKDELVSNRSRLYLRKHPQIEYHLLEKSTHYYYPKDDEDILFDLFKKLCFKMV